MEINVDAIDIESKSYDLMNVVVVGSLRAIGQVFLCDGGK
jgi:hypothetical protein